MAITSGTTNKLEFLLTLSNGSEETTRKISLDDPRINGSMSNAEFEAAAISLARLLVSNDVVTGSLSGVDSSMPKWNEVFQPAQWRDFEFSGTTPYTTTKCDYQVVSTTTTRWTED